MIKIDYSCEHTQKYSDMVYDKTLEFVLALIKDMRHSEAAEYLEAHQVMLAIFAMVGDCLRDTVATQLEQVDKDSDCSDEVKAQAKESILRMCVDCSTEVIKDSLPINIKTLEVKNVNLSRIEAIAKGIDDDAVEGDQH